MSVRSAVALQHGVDEQQLDQVDHYEDSELSAPQRAALALADVYLTSPAQMSEPVKQQVAAHLTPTQVVELTLKLVGFSNDKVMVALGLDLDEIRPFTM